MLSSSSSSAASSASAAAAAAPSEAVVVDLTQKGASHCGHHLDKSVEAVVVSTARCGISANKQCDKRGCWGTGEGRGGWGKGGLEIITVSAAAIRRP